MSKARKIVSRIASSKPIRALRNRLAPTVVIQEDFGKYNQYEEQIEKLTTELIREKVKNGSFEKKKNKICFVVQRYGLEVNGGAELHCRQLAEKMTPLYEVHVLTTKAIDYMTWRNEYNQDEENIEGVHVHRFPVDKERNQEEFLVLNDHFKTGTIEEQYEQEWIEKQGPYCPKLVQYIREHKDEYDVFIFFTYIYYPTTMGIKEVKDKAILLSLAHNEPYLQMKAIHEVFHSPRAFFFNTNEERLLVRSRFNNYEIPYLLGGVGVDIPSSIDKNRFIKKYGIENFVLYIGRIDEGKNCNELFDYFLRYKKETKDDLKLVLMGKAVMPIPEHEDIISLGFVSDEDKFDGLAASSMLVLPSRFESLSMVVLEAFSIGKPVLVSADCAVLKAHVDKSKAGLYYRGYDEFKDSVIKMHSTDTYEKIAQTSGKQYVEENYNWDTITHKLAYLIENIGEEA